MAYSNYIVKINFNDGTNNYDLPHVQHVSDPEPQLKDVIIQGTRGDGSIRIKGGKKSQIIAIKGILFEPDGYASLTTAMTTFRNKITTEVAILTMKHLEGASYITDWTYTVVRNDEIRFPKSFRTGTQNYEVSFLVLAY